MQIVPRGGTPQTPNIEEYLAMKCEHSELLDKYSIISKQYEQSIELQDVTLRALMNPKMSFGYRVLYASLVNSYPTTLTGESVTFKMWKVRENAGWASKECATKFFQDLVEIQACTYDSGDFRKPEEEREGIITGNIDIFPYPELFDTRSTERRKKGRAKEQEKRDIYRILISQCESCSSPDIEYGLLPRCKACGHVHARVVVPADRLIITQGDDDFLPDFDNIPTLEDLSIELPLYDIKSVKLTDEIIDTVIALTEPIPLVKKQRVLCGHDKKYWFKYMDGSPGCELCDAFKAKGKTE